MTGFGARWGMVLTLAGASCAWGQSVISAHSGMIHYVEGKVMLEGQPVAPKFGDYPEVKNDQVLETAEGRAEVLLTPGVFLRLTENSSFKMLSNKLSDTALEVVSGSVMVEVDELLKDNAITLRYKEATIALSKAGLYRVDADAGRLRVYDGEASTQVGLKTVEVHKGKQVELNDALLASSFDVKDTDGFYRWASRRSEYIAAANVSAAHAAGSGGLNSSVPCVGQASTTTNLAAAGAAGSGNYCNPYNNYGYGPGYGGYYSPYGAWAWNPYFGMFTYLPGNGYGYSPFGWAIYSPSTVGQVYAPGAYTGSAVRPVAVNRASGPTAVSAVRSPSAISAAGGNPIRANSAGGMGSGSGTSAAPSRGGSVSSGSSSGGVSAGSGASASAGHAASGGGGAHR